VSVVRIRSVSAVGRGARNELDCCLGQFVEQLVPRRVPGGEAFHLSTPEDLVNSMECLGSHCGRGCWQARLDRQQSGISLLRQGRNDADIKLPRALGAPEPLRLVPALARARVAVTRASPSRVPAPERGTAASAGHILIDCFQHSIESTSKRDFERDSPKDWGCDTLTGMSHRCDKRAQSCLRRVDKMEDAS
jgi:hypothetical protein